jgi:hypothetical protein
MFLFVSKETLTANSQSYQPPTDLRGLNRYFLALEQYLTIDFIHEQGRLLDRRVNLSRKQMLRFLDWGKIIKP